VHEIEDDFFTFRSREAITISATAESLLATYLSSTSTSYDYLNSCPLLKNIFIQLNTALPSSAACERLFSVAGRVFLPTRMTMTDEHFEQQLLLRINESIVTS
jgi:hypothetical protein